MIEATCGACGTVNRIAENDVPVGAKFVACASCKSRVALPTNTRFGAGAAPRSPADAVPSPPAGGNRGDVINLGLADLPAPKRQSPLGTDPSRAAPPSGLAAAGAGARPTKPTTNPLDLDDLLAPPGGGLPPPTPPRNQIADLPAPKTRPAVADLPAPKAPAGGLGPAGGPPPRGVVADLPAPKASVPTGLAPSGPARPPQIGDLPPPKPSGSPPPGAAVPGARGSIEDLPAPKAAPGLEAAAPPPRNAVTDLPAPKGPAGAPPPTPAPRGAAAISDLPAPRGPSAGSPARPAAAPPPRPAAGLSDLPAPRGPAGVTDLPAPRGPAGVTDLPAPRGPAAYADLPAPKGPAGYSDLPTPKGPAGYSDLPTPKGPAGYSDLPTPKGPAGYSDLPTPKGPAGYSDLPTPKGPAGYSDLPMPKPGGAGDLPAPKGFFDDLPQPAIGRGAPELPAPKGFFDDLPQPSQNRGPQLPAPKGFFDDLPQPSQQLGGVPAPKGFFEDLPADRSGAPEPFSAASLFGRDESPPAGHGALDLGGPELDLGSSKARPAPSGGNTSFDDLDLSAPSTAPAARFEQAQARNQTSARSTNDVLSPANAAALPSIGATRSGGGPDLALELEEPRFQTPRLGPKRDKDQPEDPVQLAARGKRQKLILAAVAGVVVIGGVGYAMYSRHAKAEAKREEIATELGKARTALAAGDATHWSRALAAAKRVQELDETDPDGLGLGAEAALAGALDDGQGAGARFAQGNKMINTAREAGVTSPALDRAVAISALASGQADRALQKLQPLAAATPTDGFLQLYVGWADEAKGDHRAAIAAFNQAMAASPAAKLPALYGRARAELAAVDYDSARTDFAAVLALAKDHIGAQVGLAAATPPSQATQQEADLLAILARKDIAAADPRAVVQAWTLAGDDARKSGRLDAARERYRKALAISASDVAAMSGLAEVELRDGKLDVANELITRAVTAAPNDVRAQLVYCQLAIRQGKLDDAAQRVKSLFAKQPPPSKLELARLDYVQGKLLEARGDNDGAIDAWIAGGKVAGELDLAPTMAAVTKLAALAKDEPDPAKANALRTRADDLLGTLGEKAKTDPALALTLGEAYLDAGAPAKAESLLEIAAAARPKDPEPKFQLAKTLVKLIRPDEAIEDLRAAIELDPSRADIGLELAKAFEAAGRDPDAGAQYDTLLQAKEPAVELRARAGRYYARTNQLPKAIAQAGEILRRDPTNAAGYYLKGEGLLQEGKLEDASRAFQSAVDADPDPQYLDAQGRAAEARALGAIDGQKFADLALRAYEQASKGAPAMFNPLAGQGRLWLARNGRDNATKALPLLIAANKLRPDDADVTYNIGRAYDQIGDHATAVRWIQRAVEQRPTADSWEKLAELYEAPDVNATAEAATAYGNAIALGTKDNPQPDWLTEAYFRRGRLLGTVGNLSGQKEMYIRYLERHPAQSARVDEARRDLATKLRDLR